MKSQRGKIREAVGDSVASGGRVRLQRYISDAGICSRRHAEQMIIEGRVLVNDAVVDSLPAFVHPQRDVVIADGLRIRVQPSQYWLLHKPKGVVCTNFDPDGRPRAVDLLPPEAGRLYPVGRLDEESSGLLLMTNDGELAQRVAHPSFSVPKVYHVEIRGHADSDLVGRMKKGVFLSEGKASATEVEIAHAGREKSVLVVTLREARNRQVRRMLARLGHPVKKLKRIAVGPLSLKGLPVGACRALAPRELAELRRLIAAGSMSETHPDKRPRRRAVTRSSKASRSAAGGRQGRASQPAGPPKRRVVQ